MNRAAMVRYALAQVGQPYRLGGAGRPFDCSELTLKALAAGGVQVEHNAAAQAVQLRAVANNRANRRRLQPGDLMFYYGSVRHPETITHCAVYVGKSLGRYMVVAAVDDAHGVMRHRSDWALKPCGFGLLSRAA